MKLTNIIWLSAIVVLLGLSGCTDGDRVYSVHAVGDDVVIDAGGSVEIAVLENDTATADGDIDVSDNLILNYIIQQPIHGSVTKNGNTVVYAHDGTDSTVDSFKYEAAISPGTIDMKTDEASVTITIRQPDSPPTNQAPIANAGEDKTVQSGESITITGSGTDNDGMIVSYKWEKGAIELATTAEFTYSPTVVGTDTLILTVTDDDGATASDEVNVTVTEASNTKPVANTSIIYMDPECRVDVIVPFEHNLTGSDADGDSLAFELVSNATYGTVIVENDGNGTFTLNDSEDSNRCMDGMDNNFTFKVNDGIEDSDPAMVEIQNPV